jgi:hypothetical protein
MPARSWSKGTDHAAQYPRGGRRRKIAKPQPNCPTCGKGFMRSREEYDSEQETRVKYEACDVCGAGFDELGNTWGSLSPDTLRLRGYK